MTIATSLTSPHGQSVLSPFLLRETETQRDTEREQREKTLLTQTSSLSSLNKCIEQIFWGPKVTKKPYMQGNFGFSSAYEARDQCCAHVAKLSPALSWLERQRQLSTSLQPWCEFIHKGAALPMRKGKLTAQTPHFQSHLMPFSSRIPLYHLSTLLLKSGIDLMALPHFC